MTKVLLISDTHGHLGVINDLVEKTKVDLVIHAGDFGFYNEFSYKHISSRELLLLVSHSQYWKNYQVNKQTDRATLIEIVKRHQFMRRFEQYPGGSHLTILHALTADTPFWDIHLQPKHVSKKTENTVTLETQLTQKRKEHWSKLSDFLNQTFFGGSTAEGPGQVIVSYLNPDSLPPPRTDHDENDKKSEELEGGREECTLC